MVSTIVKLAVSALVILFAIPGLIIEPGPISEIVAVGIVGSIWGLDIDTGGGEDNGGGGG